MEKQAIQSMEMNLQKKEYYEKTKKKKLKQKEERSMRHQTRFVPAFFLVTDKIGLVVSLGGIR